MPWLDQPTRQEWDERQAWFEQLAQSYESSGGSFGLSEQACALCGDVQLVFCAGAWCAVIIMALAVVDAQHQELAVPEYREVKAKGGLSSSSDYEWLIRRRNQLVHLNPNKPAITLEDQWDKREELEGEARKAIKLMFDGLFSDVGT